MVRNKIKGYKATSWEASKSKVFNLDLKEEMEQQDASSHRRVFQTEAAAIVKGWPP